MRLVSPPAISATIRRRPGYSSPNGITTCGQFFFFLVIKHLLGFRFIVGL